MTAASFPIDELRALADAACDGALTDGDAARLEQLLRGNPQAQQYYLALVRLDGCLRWEFGNQAQEQSLPADIAPPSIPLPTHHSLSRPSPLSPFAVGGPVFSYIAATLILGVMLLGAWAYKITRAYGPSFVQNSSYAKNSRGLTAPGEPAQRPDPIFVARVTGMKDCRWADPATETYAGAYVPLGRKYALSSGLMEITYRSGAKVLLEGPCSYEVESTAGGFLALGKLTARVESGETRGLAASAASVQLQAAKPQAPSPKPQISKFTVHTPTALVTDLGTEFGVSVDANGDTTSLVFQGRVVVRAEGPAASDPRGPAASAAGDAGITLAAGQSARVAMDAATGAARIVSGEKAVAAPRFVRRIYELPKYLDLLDIVAGGNGRGNRREAGIDPVLGRYVQTPVEKARDGDGQYWRTAWNRLIDGVFVPQPGIAVQLDSAGNTFDGFAGTLGRTFGNIWVRAAAADPNMRFDGVQHWIHAIERSGPFMPEGRGLLGLHPDAGITFDLQAVREMYPGLRPERFRATIGLADSVEAAPILDSVVDFRVFIDGRAALERIGLTRRDGAVEAAVEIGPRDRFLTLVSTDGGDGITSDWFVLGDPALTLIPINKEAVKNMKQ